MIEYMWFLMPVYMANIAPVLVRDIDILDIPVDLGTTWRGRRIFGENKTYRGLFFGILFAVLVTVFMSLLPFKHLVPYAHPLAHGLLLGASALLGDLTKSFFKRRIGISPGTSWFPFDQADSFVASMLAASYFYTLPVFKLILIGTLSHIAAVWAGWMIGLREQKI